MSFSQHNQDLDVLLFHDQKHYGFYVDIGAGEGIQWSNTYLFEHTYNWIGICVEPDSNTFELLRNNRPKSLCYNVVVDSVNIQTPENLPHTTITSLLDTNNAPSNIEYLSFTPTKDTTNSFEVLQAIDFAKYTFGLVSIELERLDINERLQIRELFISNGYEHIQTNEAVDWYAYTHRI